MTPDTDLGIRCDRHVGEAFPPRCADCDAATAEHANEQSAARTARATERTRALAADRAGNRPPALKRRRPWSTR